MGERVACRFLTEKNKTRQNKTGRGGEVGANHEAPHPGEGGVGELGKESESRPLLLPGGRVPRGETGLQQRRAQSDPFGIHAIAFH